MNQSGTNIFEEYEIKPLIPIQGANKAGIMPDGSLAGTRPEHLPKLTFFERLFGRSASPTDQVGAENITVSQTPRVGGIFPDISAGYRENRNTPISVNNFGQNKLEDGRNKGFAYKLGEGLGSFARFAESPAGRGLLVAGLVGATGGGALPALAFGGSTSLMNQQNRTKDKIYKNSLIEQGQNSLRNTAGFADLTPEEQQAQLDRIANQVNSYRGYLGDDTYKQVLAGMQLRDNAEYRNALLAGQRKDQEMAIQQRQAELKQRALSEAADRALKSRELDIKEYQTLNEGKETQNNEQKLNEMQAQLDDFVSTFDLVDNPYRYRIAGGVSNVLNTLTPEEANFNAKRTLLFNAIARKLADEKGVLSDQDIKRIDDALPKLADTKKQKMAKMGATYSLLDIRRGYKTPQAQAGNTTKSGVKYEVID